MNKEYRIGEIADLLRVSTRTLRYYEELGFITPSRSQGGYRLYNEGEVERARLVLTLKALGISLEEVASLVNIEKGSAKDNTKLLASVKERRAQLTDQIALYKKAAKEMDIIIDYIEKCMCCSHDDGDKACTACMDKRSKDVKLLSKLL